jgi:diacylglycerol O-acyltransferase
MALNITLETYADTMNFGFIGDREAVPHLQRLAVYTGEALTALERGLGLPSDAGGTVDTGVTAPVSGARKRADKPGAGPSSATRAALAKPAKKGTAKKGTANKAAST